MSLPDTAEYWNDIKTGRRHQRPVPVHSSKYPCKVAREFNADPDKTVYWRRNIFKVTCKHCIRSIPEEVFQQMKKQEGIDNFT